MLSSTFPRLCGTGILADQPQHQDTDRAYGGRSARMPGPGPAGVPARDHIAVPAEHGIRAHHQVQSLEHVPREPVQQRRQQRPISRGEPATCPDRVAAAGPRAGGAARGSLRLCPGCSSAAATTVRTHLPYQGRPVAAARLITMPQRSSLARAAPLAAIAHNIGLTHASAPTSMDEVFGRSSVGRSPAGLAPYARWPGRVPHWGCVAFASPQQPGRVASLVTKPQRERGNRRQAVLNSVYEP
jgi:hypothetical protein